MRVWNIMIGEKKMPKKEIQHLNSNKKDSKEMAEAKQQEFVNVEWVKTPSWTLSIFEKSTPANNEYKLFTEKNDKKSDDSE